jgi:hypothetical protein
MVLGFPLQPLFSPSPLHAGVIRAFIHAKTGNTIDIFTSRKEGTKAWIAAFGKEGPRMKTVLDLFWLFADNEDEQSVATLMAFQQNQVSLT